MKKFTLKLLVSILTFVITVILFGKVMNRGNVNTTRDMGRATLPVVHMNIGGEYVNTLYGYKTAMNAALLRENITPLDDDRGVSFRVDKYGQLISHVAAKVRTLTGDRLIETIDITEYDEDEYGISGRFTLKDLLEPYKEYSLEIVLTLMDGTDATYYTRIIKADSYCTKEKLSFVRNFVNKEATLEDNEELKTYMESNYKGDNTTLANITIHSSMKQLAYADLNVKRETEPVITIKEIAPETGIFLVNYLVSTAEDSVKSYYYVEEYFRIKYTSEVTYLLDYTREMQLMPDEKVNFVRDKDILLGINDESKVSLIESEDGSKIAFSSGNRLFSYDAGDNRLINLFSFYDKDNFDVRTYNDAHVVKPLNIDEAGNVWFVVYGYMNRGNYEGHVGLTLYFYNGVSGVIEEKFFIDSTKSYEMVESDLSQLSFVSRDNVFFFMLDGAIYAIEDGSDECEMIVSNLEENSYSVSQGSTMLVWIDGHNVNATESLNLMNLNTRQISKINAPAGQYIKPLAFMGEDFIYGLSNINDVLTDEAGRTVFPMYTVKIQNKYGELLKEYKENGIYVSDLSTVDDLMTLSRVKKKDADSDKLEYVNISSDYITNNQTKTESINTLNTFTNGDFQKSVRILLKHNGKNKTVYIKPQEVIYEGSNEIYLSRSENSLKYYYTYYNGKLQGVYTSEANAVNSANNNYGTVLNEAGNYIWYRANRSQRNQIMDLSKNAEPKGETYDSLVFCLNNMIEYEGIIRNTQYLMSRGQTVLEILNDALEGYDVLDLTGSPLDAMLYYVNRDIPVLALTSTGDAYLVIGFNSLAIVVYEPNKGTYKIGINEASLEFEKSGNRFITYIPN